ncbi:hypothetical protein BKA70DRAFT_1388205 [Coprinopsis sp. MPI-PUGE-AT-0042]|nr:hypothetical protein BKA70DRAFT_1388205 [Coprinopsis sp. MPI-PUGE-AT-0042]
MSPLSSPGPPTPLSLHGDLPCTPFCDSVIESLRKPLHTHMFAPPLSIASYRLATLAQLVASVRDTGSKAGSQDSSFRGKERYQESDEEAVVLSLPDAHVPLGLIANLSLSNTPKPKHSDDAKHASALAEDDFNDDNVILVHGLVTPSDVKKLFGHVSLPQTLPFISLLDRATHTPENTFARCPFLFTVVCAVASRFYPEKSQVYPVAMHFAKSSAASALIDGWLYTGLAIRFVFLLSLRGLIANKKKLLNKTRVWMICYNLDRSTATQFGKPSTIKEDYIVRNAKDWYKKSKYNDPFDVHLAATPTLLQIVAKFHDEIFSDPSGMDLGYSMKIRIQMVRAWCLRKTGWSSSSLDPACNFRRSLMPLMFSFGFQQALVRGLQAGDEIYFTKCLESAKSVVLTMLDSLAPSGYMRYAADDVTSSSLFRLLSFFASFASAFLLKEGENEIFDLISRLITPSVHRDAIDDRHTPRLYARFLAGLLFRHRRDGTQPPPPTHGSSGPAPAPLLPPLGGQVLVVDMAPTEGLHTTVKGPIQAILSFSHPKQTFGSGSGAIHFGPNDLNSYSVNAFTEEETLATMEGINTLVFCLWPEASPSPPASGPSSSGSPYLSSGSRSLCDGFSWSHLWF